MQAFPVLPMLYVRLSLSSMGGWRGGDHRSDYFSCCCVIARLWHVIRGNGLYLSQSQRGMKSASKPGFRQWCI